MFRLPIILFLIIPFLSKGQTTPPSSTLSAVEGNQIETVVGTDGTLWWDYSDASYRLEGEPANLLFSGGIWIGGLDESNQLRMAAQTYRQSGVDFWPGPIEQDDDLFSINTSKWDRHWKVDCEQIELLKKSPKPIPLEQIPQDILSWPAVGNPYAIGNRGEPLIIERPLAPFFDMDSDGIYRADLGDLPDFPGHNALFWVFNDNAGLHTESGGTPLKVQIAAFAYTYNSNAALATSTFYRYIIENRSTQKLHDLYFGQHVDADLGAFDDDFVGCDTLRNMGITYNGDANDGPTAPNFGSQIPTVGVDILRGARNSETAENRRNYMSGFGYYDSDFSITGNPETAIHFYYLLTSRWKDGSAWSYGGNGCCGSTPFPFMFPSPPSEVSPDAWSECAIGNTPFDRRFIMSSGPFALESGQSDTIDIAVVSGPRLAQSGCAADWSVLQQRSDYIQGFYEGVILSGAYKQALLEGYQAGNTQSDLGFTLYPNPSRGVSLLTWPEALQTENITVAVFDLQGKLMRRSAPLPANSYLLEAWTLNPGMYLVRIEDNGHPIRAERWMVSY